MASIRAAAVNTVDSASSGGPTLNGLQVGDLIVIKVANASGAIPTGIASNLDGAFSMDVQRQFNFAVQIWHLVVSTAGNHTVTITYANSQTFRYQARAWEGLTGSLGGTNFNSGSAATISCGSVTASSPAIIETMVQVGGGASSFTDGGDGFTVVDIQASNRTIEAHKISTGETTTGPIATNGSVSYDAVIAWFPQLSAPPVEIDSVTPDEFADGQTGIVIAGEEFGADPGRVVVSPVDHIDGDVPGAPTIGSAGANLAVTNGTSNSVTMPTGIQAGDLLLIFAAHDTSGTVGCSGWSDITNTANGTACRLAIFAKRAAGSDTATLTGSNNDMAAKCIRIPAAEHSVTDVTTIPRGTAATGSNNAPNPPSVGSLNSALHHLAIAVAASDDDDDTPNYAPSTYTPYSQHQSASSTSSSLLQIATKAITGSASEDPGNFALAATEEWVTQTLAIPQRTTSLGPSVEQTVTAWADDEVTITAVQGALAPGAAYLFVERDGGGSNASGYPITLTEAGGEVYDETVTLAVSGALAPSRTLTLSASVSLATEAGINEGRSLDAAALVTLAAQAEASPAAAAVIGAVLGLDVQALLALAGGRSLDATVSLEGVLASLTAARLLTVEGLAGLEASAGLTAIPSRGLSETVALEAVAGLTTTRALALLATVSLAAEGALIAAPQAVTDRVVALVAQAGLTAAQVASVQAQVALLTQAALDARGGRDVAADVAFAVAAAVDVIGSQGLIEAISLGASAGLSADARRVRDALLGLGAVAALTPSVTASVGAVVGLAIRADILAARQSVMESALLLGASAQMAEQAGAIYSRSLTLDVLAALDALQDVGVPPSVITVIAATLMGSAAREVSLSASAVTTVSLQGSTVHQVTIT